MYHGMMLSLDRRDVRGVTVNANYTWSRCIGDYSVLYNPMGAHPTDTYADPDNRDLDRGRCDSDRRHVLNLTTVVETPEFSQPTLRLLASGWRGPAFTPRPQAFLSPHRPEPIGALNGLQVGAQQQVLQRADQVLADPYGDRSGARHQIPQPGGICAAGARHDRQSRPGFAVPGSGRSTWPCRGYFRLPTSDSNSGSRPIT